jgi:hypothetical protein
MKTERRSIKLRRRMRTRRLAYPWPFLYGVEGGELMKNLPPEEPSAGQDAKKDPGRPARRRIR